MDRTTLARQKGFLALTLIIIILIVGFIGAAIAYMLSSSGRSTGHSTQSNQALSLAEAGLSKAAALFTANSTYPCPITISTGNSSCAASAWSSFETLGRGQFQYITLLYTGSPWSSSYAPSAPVTTTTSSLSSSASPQVLRVSSVANFAPIGQIMVGSSPINYINYTGISTKSADCGGSGSCFTGVMYSAGTTLSSGKSVSQNQTVLSASVSTSSSPQVIRIANGSNLAPFGQVIIKDQLVTYTGLSSDSAVCGGSGSCLLGASYTTGSTLPTNSRVSQNQIVIQGRGGVPNLSNPQGSRTVASPLLVSSISGGEETEEGSYCGIGGGSGGSSSSSPFSVGGWTEIVN